MSRVTANGIQIEYETFGNPSDRPLLLVIGLGGQLIWWGESLCQDLVSRGHYVIRYDNRDAGLSTKFDQAGKPDVMGTLGKILSGDKSSAMAGIQVGGVNYLIPAKAKISNEKIVRNKHVLQWAHSREL